MTDVQLKTTTDRKSLLRRLAAATGLCLSLTLMTTGAGARTAHALLDFDSSLPFSGNFLAAQLAGKQHDIEAAATFYRNALQADPQNPLLMQSAFQLLLADGRIKDALPLAEKILARDKGNHLARLALGIEAFKRGNFERARVHFTQMQQHQGTTVPATILDLTAAILSGWAYQGQDEPETAFRSIDRLKGPDWYDVFKNYHTGLMAEMSNRKSEAAKRIAAAFKGDASGLRVVEAQAINLARAGKKDDALAVLRDFEKVTPDHPLVADLRADIESGRVPQPLITNAQSGAAELLFGIGAAIGREGGEEIAAVYLQLSMWLDPKAELPLITLASVQSQLKNYQKSVDLLERIPATSKLKPTVDIQIGRYYNVLEKFERARDRLQDLVKHSPNNVEAVMALGDVLRGNKNFKEAAESYTRAIAAIPKPTKNDWALFYYRAICYERTKEWDKAEADFFKALELNPDEPHVLNYLGYSWIDMGINLDKGLQFVKKAVELKPDDGYIVDSLGWAYFKLGRYEEAVKTMERAVLLKPEDPVINDHLGDAYWKVDRKLEATFQWAHSRDLKPEPEDLAKTIKKLKDGLTEPAGPAEAKIATPPEPAKAADPAPSTPAVDTPPPAAIEVPPSAPPAIDDAPKPAAPDAKPATP